MKISVVIPLLNEEGNLPALKSQLLEVLVNITHDFEIILVDDGSTDSSLEIIRGFNKEDAHIKGISFS